MTKFKAILPFVVWVAAFEAISFAFASMTDDNISTWYALLEKPPLLPPNWVFPVMWTILYALTACAGYLLWRRRREHPALFMLFAVYMPLNWSWSLVYFGMHAMGVALAMLVVMDALLAALIVKSWRPVRPAAMLLVPLLLWSLFATYLNGGTWALN